MSEYTLQDQAEELIYLTMCTCPPTWSERRMHSPECVSEYRGEIISICRAAGLSVPG